MIFTFFKAQGYAVGNSMVEEAQTGLAKQLLSKAAEKGVKLLLPTDVVVADQYAADAHTQIVSADQISEGWMVSFLRWRMSPRRLLAGNQNTIQQKSMIVA